MQVIRKPISEAVRHVVCSRARAAPEFYTAGWKFVAEELNLSLTDLFASLPCASSRSAAGAMSDAGEDVAQRLSFIPQKQEAVLHLSHFGVTLFRIYNKHKWLKNTFKRQFKEKRQLQSSYATFTDQTLD